MSESEQGRVLGVRIAIVGAGATGLAAGHRLTGLGHDVVLYERDAQPGGRACTRRPHGCLLDHGAQYLTLPDDTPAVRRLVLEELPREGLFDVARPVWTFDRSGRVAPGDPARNAAPKWTYAEGLGALAERLAAGLAVRYRTRVARLQRQSVGYQLIGEDGAALGGAERVLAAIPAAYAIELLQASELASDRRAAALAELAKVRYRSILSVALGYTQPPAETIFAGGAPADPRPYYALVNTDRGHDVSWLAVENDKGPQRVPQGTLALIVQMGAAFSTTHFDAAPEWLAAQAAEAARRLLGVDLGRPLWHDVARWRYALPDVTCDLAALNHAHDGLLFAGDYVAGGRVHLALQAGLDAAELLLR